MGACRRLGEATEAAQASTKVAVWLDRLVSAEREPEEREPAEREPEEPEERELAGREPAEPEARELAEREPAEPEEREEREPVASVVWLDRLDLASAL